MTAIVTIRPSPGDAATMACARELGLTVESHPMFATQPVPWSSPDPGAFDCVLFGSANAVRTGGPDLARLGSLRAYCVGEKTAAAVREAGFHVAFTGTGGLQSVVPHAAREGRGRMLRLAGEAHAPLNLPADAELETLVLYRVEAFPVPPALAETLTTGAVVLLHSGEAAAHFAREVDAAGLERPLLSLACLAPRIAAMAGGGWHDIRVSPNPDDAALLAIARQMCETLA